MSVMKGTHGGHEADDMPLPPRFADGLAAGLDLFQHLHGNLDRRPLPPVHRSPATVRMTPDYAKCSDAGRSGWSPWEGCRPISTAAGAWDDFSAVQGRLGCPWMTPNGARPLVSNRWEQSDLQTDVEPTQTAEVSLVRRAVEGDRDAFADLVRLHQRRAVSVAYRLLGNIEDAGDVSQEAFVRAYRNLSQLEDPSRFGAWLMRVMTNLSLNYRRARAGRSVASLDEEMVGSAEVRNPATGRRATVGAEDEHGALPQELSAAISDAIDQLPEKQRLSLILFSVEGMPQKEVAEILDCSIELVKWNVFQARRKLKEMLRPFL